MANKNLFGTKTETEKSTAVNAAGGRAYESSHKQALAQIAATNCFNGTYYARAEDNLKIARDAAQNLVDDPQFIAKVALYSRSKSYMKDMPAFLTVVLAGIDTKLFRQVFPLVIDNGRMLRNFIQIARSGQTGRTFNMSAGTCRHAIRDWFASKSSHAIFNASIGNDPSMRDILRMARPRPDSKEKAALYGYLKGAELDKKTGAYRTYNKDGSVRYEHPFEALPQIVREYEQYKMTKEGTPPNVDFRMLDSLGLGQSEWTDIARNAPWMMTRMNLNTFARHGVFEDTEVSDLIAARLSNREQIEKSRAFPYQLMSAWKATSGNEKVPHNVREALQDAMEIAIDNVPKINGQVFVCVDTSGSMGSPVTGDRRGYGAPSTSVSCVDVAGLIASSVVRNNSSAQVLTFKSDAVRVELNPRDTVLTNTEKLASAGGGTNCSSALAKLNQERATGDVIIYVSDYESWVDSDYGYGGGYGAGTGMLSEWSNFQERNPNAKLVCIDLTPGSNSQVKERPNILQVGGFSDTVFDVVKNFIEHGDSDNHWVDEIEKIEINSEKA